MREWRRRNYTEPILDTFLRKIVLDMYPFTLFENSQAGMLELLVYSKV